MADENNNEPKYDLVENNNEPKDDLVEKIIEKVRKLNVDQQRFVLRQLLKFEYMDRRQHKRFRCENLIVGFDVEGTQSKEHVHDISEGGAFIKTEMPVVVGQKAILTFSDADGRTQYRVNSTIVRAVNDGVALVFDADNAHQRLKLKTIMNYARHVGYALEE
ncbi:Type IV pilus assembly PilZ domain protein [Candidatus Magnetomorum sp. HK-1]|nr:Type IV pilus assembly PilZ domain protein [Candidatus Magnetomorum sp. HK-1]